MEDVDFLEGAKWEFKCKRDNWEHWMWAMLFLWAAFSYVDEPEEQSPFVTWGDN